MSSVKYFIALLICCFGNQLVAQTRVQCHVPYDLTFKSKVIPANPFLVEFSAEMTNPKGLHLTLPGFYDGNGTWKVRFSAISQGRWQIVTHSSLSDLNGQKRELSCGIATAIDHGQLLVDPGNRKHFIYEDGTHWFPVGYECNWLWAMDAEDDRLPIINKFLDKITSYGFNMILLNAYAYDTSWRIGKTGEDDYGPSALYPWAGDYQNPDFSRFDLHYWQHFDKVMEALNKKGIIAHIYLKVCNKKVNWPPNDSQEDDQYYRWIIARYAAYPNIIWDLAKEANYEKSVAYKTARLKYIRATDPYRHLLTVHTDFSTYDIGVYNDFVDFRTDQYQKDVHQTMLKNLGQNNWPVMNVESGYESGPKGLQDKTYSSAQSPEECARRIWEIQLAGGYNAYYYTYTAWDVIRPDDNPPGYVYLKNFTDFFKTTRYWLLKNNDALVSKGYCLADDGKEYIVYQNDDNPFTLNLAGVKARLKAKWYQAFTGQYLEAGELNNGLITFSPPATLGKGPMVLHITAF
jgi:hypothetical protein